MFKINDEVIWNSFLPLPTPVKIKGKIITISKTQYLLELEDKTRRWADKEDVKLQNGE